MTVLRFTEAQLEARRKRMTEDAKRKAGQSGTYPSIVPTPVCPSCGTPADRPHPTECAWATTAVGGHPGNSNLSPSPAFVEAFGKAQAVVEEYIGRKDRARGFILRLPVPQSVNANTHPTATGGRVLTDEHRAFRTHVAVEVYNAKAPKLYGRLRVYIRVNAPRVDIDNIVKPTLDALQRAGAIDNDRNVDDLHVVRAPVLLDGMLDVEVGEL